MKRPHILWIMTDQHRFDALSCTGGLPGMTPNLDRLAQDGVLFRTCYTPSPVCGPARAALKSGCFPPGCGAVKNWRNSRDGIEWLPQRLADAGYDTGMAGKLHLFPNDRSYGFRWKALSDAPYSVYAGEDKQSQYIRWLREQWHGKDPVPFFDGDESAYNTDLHRFIAGSGFRSKAEHETVWTGDRALEYLANRPADRPFFFFLSYFGPHQPYLAPSPYDRWADPDEITLPRSFYEDCMKGHPVFEATCRALRSRVETELTEYQVRRLAAQYYGQIRMIDEDIGRVLDELRRQNLYDDTMIIFTSDHGDHLGQYGLFFKGQMYDSCCRVPLIIKPAGKGQTGRTVSQVVNSLDLYGTVLDAAGDDGWKTPQTEAGSLTELLADGPEGPGEARSIVGADRNRAVCMLRRGPWKLIRLATGDSGHAVYELYDLESDPEETIDRYEDADAADVRARLQPELDDWFRVQYSRYPK